MKYYRILKVGEKYKAQVKGWFFWSDITYRYRWDDTWQTIYFDTIAEVKDCIYKLHQQNRKPKPKENPKGMVVDILSLED